MHIQPQDKSRASLAWSVADSEVSLDEIQRLVGVDAENAILLSYVFVTATPANATPPPMATNVLPSPMVGSDVNLSRLASSGHAGAALRARDVMSPRGVPNDQGSGASAKRKSPGVAGHTKHPRTFSWLPENTSATDRNGVSELPASLLPSDDLVATTLSQDVDTVGENTCMGLLAVLGTAPGAAFDPAIAALSESAAPSKNTQDPTHTKTTTTSWSASADDSTRLNTQHNEAKPPRPKKRIAPVLIRAPSF